MQALKGLAQPQACRAGDVSATPCLQAAAELAAATRLRLRQAFQRTLRSQKQQNFVRWVQTLGIQWYKWLQCTVKRMFTDVLNKRKYSAHKRSTSSRRSLAGARQPETSTRETAKGCQPKHVPACLPTFRIPNTFTMYVFTTEKASDLREEKACTKLATLATK